MYFVLQICLVFDRRTHDVRRVLIVLRRDGFSKGKETIPHVQLCLKLTELIGFKVHLETLSGKLKLIV